MVYGEWWMGYDKCMGYDKWVELSHLLLLLPFPFPFPAHRFQKSLHRYSPRCLHCTTAPPIHYLPRHYTRWICEPEFGMGGGIILYGLGFYGAIHLIFIFLIYTSFFYFYIYYTSFYFSTYNKYRNLIFHRKYALFVSLIYIAPQFPPLSASQSIERYFSLLSYQDNIDIYIFYDT